uniref:RING-type domain-containing protein n=1 Tax=Chelonoidis abingdonii TaxID=106734 RepID=A0A8C0GR06_CHEAB
MAFSDEDKASMDCVICFSPYDRLFKVPKVLGCGHIFCLECLARINVSSEQVNAVSCPVCRELTSLPTRKGLPGLPTCLDLLDQLPLAPVAPSSSVRFSRRQGLLYVPGWGTRKGRGLALPKPGPALSTISLICAQSPTHHLCSQSPRAQHWEVSCVRLVPGVHPQLHPYLFSSQQLTS